MEPRERITAALRAALTAALGSANPLVFETVVHKDRVKAESAVYVQIDDRRSTFGNYPTTGIYRVVFRTKDVSVGGRVDSAPNRGYRVKQAFESIAVSGRNSMLITSPEQYYDEASQLHFWEMTVRVPADTIPA